LQEGEEAQSFGLTWYWTTSGAGVARSV